MSFFLLLNLARMQKMKKTKKTYSTQQAAKKMTVSFRDSSTAGYFAACFARHWNLR